jgi:ABC-type nitrate/sulfonate/bicarbonate transport system substrate-binding protein
MRTGATTRRMLLVVAAMALGFGALAAMPAGAELESRTLDVYTSKDPQLACQLEVALEKGYFKAEGLEVGIKYVSGGGEIPPAMAAGSIKVAIAAHNNALNLIARDFPVKVIGTVNDISGALGLAVRNSLNVRSPKDLEGKKIGTFVYGGTMEFLAKMSARHGVDRAKLQIVNLQPPDLAPTFARGDIDAALIWEPHLTRTARQGGTVMLTGAQASFPDKKETYRLWGMPIVVFAPQEFIDKNPNTVVALLRGLSRGQDFLMANRAEALDILTRKLSIPKDELGEMVGRNRYTMTVDQAFMTEMDNTAESLFAAKQIPKAPKATTYTVTSPMRKARPELVTVP